MCFGVFSALQLADLILWASPSAIRTQTSVPTATITFIGSLVLCILSYAEHVRTVAPSFLLNIYLFFSLLFDIARARTLWLQQYNRTIAIVFTASVAVKFVLVLLEGFEKRGLLRADYKGYPPEATSGIYSKSFFFWLRSLLQNGYRRLLRVDDLFVLDKSLASENLQYVLQRTWAKG